MSTSRGGGPRSAVVRAIGLVGAVLQPFAAGPTDLAGQSVRGWVGSTLQMVELRPVAMLAAGCLPDEPCYEALSEERSFSATQDLSLTAWGFGLQGVSATVLLRGRARLGSDLVWPRTDDRFDAILAYGQLVRDRFTVRAGRQEIRSGLGFSSFDGASVAWYGATAQFRAEAYGGRSLARGLREPDREALRAVEDFVPDKEVLVWGASARARLRGLSITTRYQREILSDRSGLASERGALDLSLATPTGRLIGAIDYDVARGEAGKGRLGWSMPLADGRWLVEATASRYVPYFSLSTIWGFFEPVAYHEVEGRVGWSPSSTLAVTLGGGWRKYGETGAATVFRPLTGHGERARLGARWDVVSRVSVDAAYELEWGPGGFLSAADVSARMALNERLSVTATATTFQQIEQYRLGDGRGLGGGLSFDAELTDRILTSGGASLLRHTGGQATVQDSPWNQSRAWWSLRVLVGEDPGLANRRRR
jgi:hypothetical protein